MSDIAVILFGPKTTEPWFRSRKKRSSHSQTVARSISEPLLVVRSVATSPPMASLPAARAGSGRHIPSIGASPSAFHHPGNKSSGASPSKTHLRAGSFECRWFGSSPPFPNPPSPQPSSLVDSSSRSTRLTDNTVPLTMDYNDRPPPSGPTLTHSISSNSLNSVKHMPKKPPTIPIPPIPSLPSGSPPSLSTITSHTSKDFETTRSGSPSKLEVVDTKATTLETVAFIPLIPMTPACPDRLPSLRRKPPPSLTSVSISSSPSTSPQLAGSSPPSTSSAATSLPSFTQECKSVPSLPNAKVDCTSAGNVEKNRINQRPPTRTPNVAPTVTAFALPLPPTQIPPTPSKVVQEARKVAHGPTESSRQRLHEQIDKPFNSSPTNRVPIDLLASMPLHLPSVGRSQSLSSSQKQPAAPSRTTPHRLKRPHRSRSAAPLYQSFLPSFDDMEEPHSSTIPPLPRRSA